MPTDLEIQMEVERLAVRDFASQQNTPNVTRISTDMGPGAQPGSEELCAVNSSQTFHMPVPPATGTADAATDSRRSRRKKLK